MSIFTKPLSQLQTSDIEELVTDSAVENLRLEFKLQVPDKENTLKKLSSFANTFGGFMIVGAKADGSDGRIQGLPGVDLEPGYKQKVVQWCFDGASPPLSVEVSDPIPAPGGNGKFCYVAYVSESDIAPHFVNGRKGVWVRTDEFSARFENRLADENELQHLLDRRKLIRERRVSLIARSRRRFHTYVAKKHMILNGDHSQVGPTLEFSIVPKFPSRQLCRQENLKDFIQQSRFSWRQMLFPDPSSPILTQHESAIVLNATKSTSMLEVNVWGMLFYGALVEIDRSEYVGIHLYQFAGLVLAFIAHANKILQQMGYVGPIAIDTSLGQIQGVPWLHAAAIGDTFLSTRQGSELDEEVGFSIDTTVEELREKPDAVAMEVLRNVLFSVNSSDLIDTAPKLEELIYRGYKYNFWPDPAALRL